jgi:hypothetical protein
MTRFVTNETTSLIYVTLPVTPTATSSTTTTPSGSSASATAAAVVRVHDFSHGRMRIEPSQQFAPFYVRLIVEEFLNVHLKSIMEN